MKNNKLTIFIFVLFFLSFGKTTEVDSKEKTTNFNIIFDDSCKVFAFDGKKLSNRNSNPPGKFMNCKTSAGYICRLLSKKRNLIDIMGYVKNSLGLYPEIRKYHSSIYYNTSTTSGFIIGGYTQDLDDTLPENRSHARLALRICNLRSTDGL